MGSGHSVASLADNSFLTRFCSDQVLLTGNDFCEHLLLSVKAINQYASEDVTIARVCEKHMSCLVRNNQKTQNLQNLIKLTAKSIGGLNDTGDELKLSDVQVICAMKISRHCLRYYMQERVPEMMDIVKAGGSSIAHLTNGMLRLIACPIGSWNVMLVVEAELFLIVLMASERFRMNNDVQNKIMTMIMDCNERLATNVMLNLLHQFCKCSALRRKEGTRRSMSAVGSDIVSSIFETITFGMISKGTCEAGFKQIPPGNLEIVESISAHLFLLLCYVLTKDNPYRKSLCSMQLNVEIGHDSCLDDDKMTFTHVYVQLCCRLNTDTGVLILYAFMQHNHSFKAFILSRSALDELVVPLLTIVYNEDKYYPHHVYMCLVLLMIFSEDHYFKDCVNDLIVADTTWYLERNVGNVSLGNLIFLVLLRAIRKNLSNSKDMYFHNNCLGILSNLSTSFRNMQTYVAQLMIKLLKLLNKMHETLGSTDGNGSAEERQVDDDSALITTLIKMLMELFNSLICNALSSNPNFVYTLLYERNEVKPFETKIGSQDFVNNMNTVMSYFTSKTDDLQVKTTDTIFEAIKSGLKTFPLEKLVVRPSPCFHYMEEDNSCLFFLPYVWTLVYEAAYIHWHTEDFKLFNVEDREQRRLHAAQ